MITKAAPTGLHGTRSHCGDAGIPTHAEWESKSSCISEARLAGHREPDQLSRSCPEEEILCGIFAEVLKLEQMGVEQDFFNLGGHSLLATQVVSRVRNAFGVDLPLRVVFASPTARRLAEKVRRSRSREQGVSVPLFPAPRTGLLPLSYAQQRLWFLDQLDPGSAIYNMPFEMRLRGQLDQNALQRSLNKIVERHEALRTRFVVSDGSPWQQIADEQQIGVELIDLSMLPENDRPAKAQELAGIEAFRPFDLAHGLLLRVKLLRFGDQDHLLLLTMHHIVSDGWSVGLMVREFRRLYEGYVQGVEPRVAATGGSVRGLCCVAARVAQGANH